MKKFVVLFALLCVLVVAQGVFAQNITVAHNTPSYTTYTFYPLIDWRARAPQGDRCNNCTLPATGFSSRVEVPLSVKPDSVNYQDLNMRIQVPALNIDAEITTVPAVNDKWAVEWLGDKAGLLSGSYLPGEGQALIAAHNTLNNTEYGPFALLATIENSDVIFVTKANNEMLRYKVYANELMDPNDMQKVYNIADQVENALVLVTCENEAVEGGYLNRRVVFAAPM